MKKDAGERASASELLKLKFFKRAQNTDYIAQVGAKGGWWSLGLLAIVLAIINPVW